MQKPVPKYYTPEEYLSCEENAEYKSEYYKGEIFNLAGASLNHSQIIGNLHAHLYQHQKKHQCRIAMSDVRLWVEENKLFTYPDIMLICNEPQFYSDRTDTIINPSMIIEILSKSTEDYDRGKKFMFYRSIPSFQEYVLIDQYTTHIEQFHIGSEGKWQLTEYNKIDEILKFSKIDFEISLKDIYYQVDFESE